MPGGSVSFIALQQVNSALAIPCRVGLPHNWITGDVSPRLTTGSSGPDHANGNGTSSFLSILFLVHVEESNIYL